VANVDIQTKLAGFVSSYIQASRQSDAASQEEALRWICLTLGSFLEECLRERNEWNRYHWIDDMLPAIVIIPDAVKTESATGLSIRGSTIWGDGGKNESFWSEPFFAAVTITEAHDAITRYELKFGNAEQGLRKTPSSKHIRRLDWFLPTEWLFTFSSDAAST
jgi:hypothetical protein